MKKISVIFNTMLLAGLLLFLTPVNAQDGLVFADEDYAFLNLGTDYALPAATFNYVQTAQGNYTVNVTWYLSPDNPFIPENGTNKVALYAVIDWYWLVGFPFPVPLEFSVDDAMVNKHGKCHAVFHVNPHFNF